MHVSNERNFPIYTFRLPSLAFLMFCLVGLISNVGCVASRTYVTVDKAAVLPLTKSAKWLVVTSENDLSEKNWAQKALIIKLSGVGHTLAQTLSAKGQPAEFVRLNLLAPGRVFKVGEADPSEKLYGPALQAAKEKEASMIVLIMLAGYSTESAPREGFFDAPPGGGAHRFSVNCISVEDPSKTVSFEFTAYGGGYGFNTEREWRESCEQVVSAIFREPVH